MPGPPSGSKSLSDWYFRLHGWESEHLCERLGARWLSRWVPTGGSEFNRLFFRFTGRRLYIYCRDRTCLEELAALTRQYETIHLGGLPCAVGLTLYEFLAGPHNISFLAVALLFDLLVLDGRSCFSASELACGMKSASGHEYGRARWVIHQLQ